MKETDMSTPLELQHSAANAKLQSVQDAKNTIIAKLNAISDSQHQMTTSGWRGDSAVKYLAAADSQQDDFKQITDQLEAATTEAMSHQSKVAQMDNG
jgi:hypothetical protein